MEGTLRFSCPPWINHLATIGLWKILLLNSGIVEDLWCNWQNYWLSSLFVYKTLVCLDSNQNNVKNLFDCRAFALLFYITFGLHLLLGVYFLLKWFSSTSTFFNSWKDQYLLVSSTWNAVWAPRLSGVSGNSKKQPQMSPLTWTILVVCAGIQVFIQTAIHPFLKYFTT